MNRTTRLLWTALVAAVLLGVVWEFYPLPDAVARLAKFPRRSLMADSRDMPLTPTEDANFSGTTVVKRLASVRGERVIVTVVDGTHNRHAIHDPVFCFRGAGWDMFAQEVIPMERGEARLVHLRQGGRTAEALYWFSDGCEQFASPLRYWWKTALRRLSLGHSGPEPVLVILTSTGDASPNWGDLLRAWPDLQAL